MGASLLALAKSIYYVIDDENCKFLTLPGRSECGVQLAWGFPPRSKWTHREVFHPAVVPQPPFNQFFFSHKTSS